VSAAPCLHRRARPVRGGLLCEGRPAPFEAAWCRACGAFREASAIATPEPWVRPAETGWRCRHLDGRPVTPSGGLREDARRHPTHAAWCKACGAFREEVAEGVAPWQAAGTSA
jgi:hypothetical protein